MVFQQVQKSRFSNGFVDNIFCYKNKLDSFRSYQLVDADLLVCMPAPGDRVKVGFDEFDKTLCAYIIF